MARKYSELRSKMSPEARARVDAHVGATLSPIVRMSTAELIARCNLLESDEDRLTLFRLVRVSEMLNEPAVIIRNQVTGETGVVPTHDADGVCLMLRSNWERGRLGTGYEKLKLFSSARLRCDAWLLRSGVGAAVPSHVDPAPPGFRHLRVNVILWPAREGGHFLAVDSLIDLPRLKVFYSDRAHAVTPIRAGSRLVLSIGVLLRARQTSS